MKKKYIIIAVVAICVVTLIGVLSWGLQPVKKDKVTLKKLNKELGDRFCMPSKLPFEGDVECFIIYNEQHWNLRFEISSDDASGYSIGLKDGKREIYIDNSDMLLNILDQDNVVTEKYNGKETYYIFTSASDTATDNSLIIQFEVDNNACQIYAKYDKDVSSEVLKSDMNYLLEQMIKQS